MKNAHLYGKYLRRIDERARSESPLERMDRLSGIDPILWEMRHDAELERERHMERQRNRYQQWYSPGEWLAAVRGG